MPVADLECRNGRACRSAVATSGRGAGPADADRHSTHPGPLGRAGHRADPPCHYAGISLVHHDRTITTEAATHPLVTRGNELQYSLGEGPCLDAIWHHDTVNSPNLATDRRWPTWAPQAAETLNVASMLSLPLFTSTTVVGGLSLYSPRAHAFEDDDIDTATVLAAHIAVAVAETQHADQLELKANNRTIIGQAQGILMERYQLDDQQAFLTLRRVSQDNNTRLIRVAEHLIRTRKTPGI